MLSFRLGSIPVRIQPTFFLITLVLGAQGGDLSGLVAWTAIVLVSVLLHELGHAGAGLAFGLEPRIDLHGMGGTTSWASLKPLRSVQRIAISLAGPFAGFAAGALVWALAIGHVFPDTEFWSATVGRLLFVNVGWGVLNLLPMLPLDGGNVLLHALHAFTGGRGERAARVVSIVVAAACVPLAILGRSPWSGLLLLSFSLSNFQGLKALRAREHDEPLHEGLQQAYGALAARDGPRVLELARPIALGSRTAPVQAEALQLVAFGFLLEGRLADADAAIAALPKGYSPNVRLLELRQETLAAQPGGPAAV